MPMTRTLLSSLVLLLSVLTTVAQPHGRLALPRRVSSDYIALGYCGGNIQYSVALQNGAPTKSARMNDSPSVASR